MLLKYPEFDQGGGGGLMIFVVSRGIPNKPETDWFGLTSGKTEYILGRLLCASQHLHINEEMVCLKLI